MLGLISGRTIKLHKKTLSGMDPFGAPIFSEEIIDVENVVISPSSDEEIKTDMQLYGKKSVYTLHLPKGDDNNWDNVEVEFFDRIWHTFGPVTEYQEEMVPLQWNKKVKVEHYE